MTIFMISEGVCGDKICEPQLWSKHLKPKRRKGGEKEEVRINSPPSGRWKIFRALIMSPNLFTRIRPNLSHLGGTRTNDPFLKTISLLGEEPISSAGQPSYTATHTHIPSAASSRFYQSRRTRATVTQVSRRLLYTGL